MSFLVVGAGTSSIDAIRRADADPENWGLVRIEMPVTWERVSHLDDRWCVIVDEDDVDVADLDRDPAVVGYCEVSNLIGAVVRDDEGVEF